jgi:hypothetical protein
MAALTTYEEAPLAAELSEHDPEIPGRRYGRRNVFVLAAVVAAVLIASAVAFLTTSGHIKAHRMSPQNGAFVKEASGHISLYSGQLAAALDTKAGPEPVPAVGSFQPGQSSGPSETCPPGCNNATGHVCCGTSCGSAGSICCNNRIGLICSKGTVCCGLMVCCSSTLLCHQNAVIDPTHHQPACGSGQQF